MLSISPYNRTIHDYNYNNQVSDKIKLNSFIFIISTYDNITLLHSWM